MITTKEKLAKTNEILELLDILLENKDNWNGFFPLPNINNTKYDLNHVKKCVEAVKDTFSQELGILPKVAIKAEPDTSYQVDIDYGYKLTALDPDGNEIKEALAVQDIVDAIKKEESNIQELSTCCGAPMMYHYAHPSHRTPDTRWCSECEPGMIDLV